MVYEGAGPWWLLQVIGSRMLLKPWARMASSCAWVTRGLPQAVSSAPTASKVLPRFQPGCMAAT